MASPLEVVVGLDAGTTSAKALVVDRDGTIVGSATSPTIKTSIPEPGAAEQRPEHIWQSVAAACVDALADLPIAPAVRAIAIASQSGSVVPVRSETSTGNAVTWMDTRAGTLVSSWDDATTDLVRRASGWTASAGLGLATISWLRSTAAGSDVKRWASVDDYLVRRLCGRWITNPSNAAGMQLMDVGTLAWSPELCSLAGIEQSLLSAIRPSGSLAGPLLAEAAATMGLAPSTPVVIGGHDQACAAFGLGAEAPGAMMLSTGTAWVLTIVSDRTERERLPPSFNTSPHVIASCWSASTYLGGLGAAIAWALDQVGEEVGAGSESESDAGSDWPDRTDPFFFLHPDQTHGSEWGHLQPVDSADSVGTADSELLLRAVMEACAFEVRRAVDVAAAAGLRADELTVVGGGTRSPHLLRLLNDVLDVDIIVRPDTSWPAVGAARLAARSLGWPGAIPAALPATALTSRPGARQRLHQRYLAHTHLRTEAPPCPRQSLP